MDLKKLLYKNIVDSTSLVIETTPVFAAAEMLITRIPEQMSINARWISGLEAYAGVGLAYSAGNKISREAFGVTKDSRKSKQFVHDFAYGTAFNMIAAPVTYLLSGSRDVNELIACTVVATVVGTANGIPLQKTMDTFSEAVKGDKSKKTLAGIIIGASALATTGIYSFT